MKNPICIQRYKNPFFFLSLLFCITASAQNQKSEKEIVIPQESWEVGTDLLWLIDKNQLPASNLFLRRNYTTDKGARRAWRLRLGVDVSSRDSVNINDPIDNELNETYLLLRFGHEWQYMVDEKALLYFGSDIQFSYDRHYEKRILSLIDPPPFGSLLQDTRTIYTPGFIGFAGARYHPMPWIALSLEANLEVLYRIKRNPSKVTPVPFPDEEDFNVFEDSETATLKISPLSTLTISFHF